MRLIDADKLLDILDVMIVGHKTASDVYDVVDRMPTVDAVEVVRCNDALKTVVRFAPTVDPVKHGHWIMKPNGYGTCSNCKMCSLDIGGGVDSDYCPNCGAKMEADDETD